MLRQSLARMLQSRKQYHLNSSRTQLVVEQLEAREVPTVVLSSIPNQNIPNNQPIYLPLSVSTPASLSGTPTFNVQSNNSSVAAQLITDTGNETLQLNISGTDSSGTAFTGTLTILLFPGESPAIVNQIISETDSGYYNGKLVSRVIPGFVIQAGSLNGDGTGAPAGLNPLPDVFNTNYTFASPGIVAMANAGHDDNLVQFFITDPSDSLATRETSLESPLNFDYSIVGILTSGFVTYADAIDTKTEAQSSSNTEDSKPVDPITITSAQIITDHNDAVIELTPTAGFTGTAKITASGTDSSGTQQTSFTVTGVADTTNSRPFIGSLGTFTTGTNPVSYALPAIDANGSSSFTIPVTDTNTGDTLTYAVRDSSFATTTIPNATFTLNQSTGAVTITPTAGFTGTITFTVGVRNQVDHTGQGVDAAANYAYRLMTLKVNADASVNITPTTLPAGISGTAYNQTLSGNGGTSPYTFVVSSGTIPTGLNLNPQTGVLSGTPTAGGAFTFAVTATDSSPSPGPFTSSPQTYTVQINAPTVAITQTAVPAATVGASYSEQLTATGGVGPYTFAINSGSLPIGLTLSNAGLISGTPTSGGTFTLAVTAKDSSTGTGPYTSPPQSYTITVNPPNIAISPSTLPNANVGTPYSQPLTASGGTAPYSDFAVSSGALPAGLTLSATGVILGTPTAGGTFTFAVTAKDSSTGTGPYTSTPQSYTLTVTPPTITINPTTLPNPTVGANYEVQLTGSGGTAPYTNFTVASGSLPPGITLSSSGLLSGTLTQGGQFEFFVTAQDSSTGTGPYTSSQQRYLGQGLSGMVTITPSSPTFPAATVGTPYSHTLLASGGTSPYTFEIASGSAPLPAGLSLNPSTGKVTGTPTAGGTYIFTIQANDSATATNAGTASYSLTVNQPVITVTPTTLPSATVGASFSQQLAASGGTSPYTFAVTSGSLPPGLTLTTAGLLSGTPTGGGPYTFDIAATDSSTGAGPYTSTPQAYTLTVSAPTVTITTTSLPSGTVGQTYSQTLAATGGTSPYSFVVSTGTLPTGLALSQAGVLSGTPTAGGSFTFTVAAEDSSTGTGPYGSSPQSYTVVINIPTITVTSTTLPEATAANAYTTTLTATGGTSPYTYTLSSGALPTGITLSQAGVLSGTTTSTGTFTFAVIAKDSSVGSGPYSSNPQSLSLTVKAPTITISPSTLAAATVGTSYSGTLTASGGTSPYTLSVTSGSLPAGVVLSSSGVLSGTPTAGGTFTFGVTAKDSSTGSGPFSSAATTYTLTVNSPTIKITPASLPAATVSQSYSQTFTGSAGTAPYTFTVSNGTLPTGLSLSSAGVLSGTPTASGTFNFTIQAKDSSTGSGPYTSTESYTMTVNPVSITFSTTSLPGGTTDSTYSASVTATGGTAPLTYKVSSGTLPPGLTLSSTGTLSGNPTTGGSYTFTVTATDASPSPGPFTGSQSYTVAITEDALAVGAGSGGAPQIVVYNPDGSQRLSFDAYESTFTGGVSVAVGDVTGSGIQDIVSVSGPGRATEVRVFDGLSGKLIMTYDPFGSSFTGGGYVAVGNIEGTGVDDIVVSADAGGGNRVVVFQESSQTVLASFMGINDPNFNGGDRVAVGDVNGDGDADVIVTAGEGGGPRVAIWSGASLRVGSTPTELMNDFYALDPSTRDGAFVTVVNGGTAGTAELVFGGGPATGTQVLVISASTLFASGATTAVGTPVDSFSPLSGQNYSTRVAAVPVANSTEQGLAVSYGPGSSPRVMIYTASDLSLSTSSPTPTGGDFFALDQAFNGGIYVG